MDSTRLALGILNQALPERLAEFTHSTSPCWVLGNCYSFLASNDPLDEKQEAELKRQRRLFREDAASLVWMTYRRSFFPISSDNSENFRFVQQFFADPRTLSSSLEQHGTISNGYSSDSGWGCMIRAGQMMLAHALIRHFQPEGRAWRRPEFDKLLESHVSSSSSETSEAVEDTLRYLHILSLFCDHPSAPMSLHRFLLSKSIHRLANGEPLSEAKHDDADDGIEHEDNDDESSAVLLGKRDINYMAGQWFGPHAVAHMISSVILFISCSSHFFHVLVLSSALVNDQQGQFGSINSIGNHRASPLRVLIPPCGLICKDVCLREIRTHNSALLLLVPMRLGIDSINTNFVSILIFSPLQLIFPCSCHRCSPVSSSNNRVALSAAVLALPCGSLVPDNLRIDHC